MNKLKAGFRSSTALNADLELIEDGFERSLSRVDGDGNQMETVLDMNGHRIINLPEAILPHEPLRLDQAQTISGRPGPPGPPGPESGIFKGLWDAATNTPTITDGDGSDGDFYTVNVAGTQDLGSGGLVFEVGDQARLNAGVWTRIEGQAAPVRLPTGIHRKTIEKVSERVSVKDFGAIGDGLSHTLETTTSFNGISTASWTLNQWKDFFPVATSLGQEIDYLAHQTALEHFKVANKPVELYVPAGKYRMGVDGVVVSSNGTTIRGEGPNATIWLSSKPDGDIFTFRNMSTGGIHSGTIAPLVIRTEGAAVRFDNGHNLISRDMKFDPGAWHGGAAGSEHWACYDMTAAGAQFLYTVEHFEMNQVRWGFRIGQTGDYVQDVWIGKGICVARRAGIQAYHVGGLYIYDMPDFLNCWWGLQCIPNVGQTVSGMMINGFLADTCEHHGIVIQPNGGIVTDFQMTNVWVSSSGTTVGNPTSQSACGLYIDGANGYVGGGIISGIRAVNNVTHGIQIRDASEITISNPQCNYNSIQAPGQYHGIVCDTGAKNVTIVGGFSGPTGKFKHGGVPTSQGYGVFIWNGAMNVKVIYVDVTGNIQTGVHNTGTNCFVVEPGSGGGGGGTVTGPINQTPSTTNVIGEITQNASVANRLGRVGVGRNPIPRCALATSGADFGGNVSLGGFEPYIGFNCYYDLDALQWRYQGNGPAMAIVAKQGGPQLVQFATNAAGADAPVPGGSIVKDGFIQVA